MSTKTDLAKEIINKISPDYAKKRSFLFGNTEISEIFIETAAEAELFGKPRENTSRWKRISRGFLSEILTKKFPLFLPNS